MLVVNKKTIIIAIFLSCLVVGTLEQRGGFRSRARARLSSIRRGSGASFMGASRSCNNINGTSTCKQTYSSKIAANIFTIIIIFSILMGVVGLFILIEQSLKEKEENKKILQNVATNFETKMKGFPSVLNNQTKQKMIDEFMKMSYKMTIKILG